MKSFFIIFALLGAATVAGAQPFELSYTGRLIDGSGKPVAGPVDLQLKLFTHETNPSLIAVTIPVFEDVVLTSGMFQVKIELTPAEYHIAFNGTDDVWVEAKDVTHNKTYPRQHFSAVPYALKVPVDGVTVLYDADGKLRAVTGGTGNMNTGTYDVGGTIGIVDQAEEALDSQLLGGDAPADFHDAAQLTGTVPVARLPVGTGAGQVAAGNDARFTNVTNLGADISLTSEVSGILPVANLPVGTTGAHVAAGNDARLSDSRAPTGAAGGGLTGTYPNPTISSVPDAALSANVSKLGADVSLTSEVSGILPVANLPIGTTAAHVTAGNDARLSDSRAPSGAAGGKLSGTYPNPGVNLADTDIPTLTSAKISDFASAAAAQDTNAKTLCPDGTFLRGEAATTCRTAAQILADAGGEVDPQVGSNATSYLSKWDGTALVMSSLFDNGSVLQHDGTSYTTGDSRYTLLTYDTTAMAAGVGGGIAFGGRYMGATATPFASIKGIKETGTNGDYAGALAFVTSANPGGFFERLRITSTGNVGIGTTSPAAALHVLGSGSGAALATSGATDATMNARACRGNVCIDQGMLDSGVGYIQNRRFDDFATNYRLAINPNGANVGVGTTNPTQTLTVIGNNPGNYALGVANLNATGSGIYVSPGADANPGLTIANSAQTVTRHVFYGSGDATLAWGAGNVGIGTLTPTARLHVAGVAGTDGIKYPDGTLQTSASDSLTSDRNYYVRTDGSNSNTGLTNTAGGAFLTVQKAIDTIASLIIGKYNVIVYVADGTYTTPVVVSGPWNGTGTVSIVGNTTTPANVVFNTTSTQAVELHNGARLTLSGMEVRTTTSGTSLLSNTNSVLNLGAAMRFGSCAGHHMYANLGGAILANASYAIVGGAQIHTLAERGGLIQVVGVTVTLTGPPAFSAAFAITTLSGAVFYYANTFVGTATGPRYSATSLGNIFVNGAGATYLPGNSAGSVSTGGQYN